MSRVKQSNQEQVTCAPIEYFPHQLGLFNAESQNIIILIVHFVEASQKLLVQVYIFSHFTYNLNYNFTVCLTTIVSIFLFCHFVFLLFYLLIALTQQITIPMHIN